MAEQEAELEEYSQKWWADVIVKREKVLNERWREAADRIVARYLDEREGASGDVSNPTRKYNVFWANTQIMKAALYATPPKPLVTRQYGDAKDDVARTASLMLQRILQFGLHQDTSDMHSAFQVCVEDRLIPGLGQVWLRLETETEPTPEVPEIPASLGPDRQIIPGAPAVPAGEKVVSQKVLTDYVHWRDFLWEACRVWSECGWVARRCWMRKTKFVKRFGQAKYDELKNKAKESKEREGKYPKGFLDGKVEVFEIWCLDTNKVYWISRFADSMLDEKEDPLQLDEFYPCPEPLISTHTTNDLMPRADFTLVQDQYDELDVLNTRIHVLTKALRVVGVYDKTNTELAQVLTGSEFNMVAVENWAVFSEQGGFKGQVDWFPVEVIANVLEKLMMQRQAVIAQIYELTSISDIMRGASNPRDTLGAQKLKAQYSSVRLQLTQQDVGRFVRQAMRIKCEIICRHFEPQFIVEQSQIEHTESVQFIEPALELLSNYRSAEYRINVGEETLSLADYNAERELRIEYLTSVGQFISQAGIILEQKPEAAPFLLKMVAWATAAFRGASDMESVLDEAIRASEQSQGQEQGQDPKVQVEEAKQQTMQMKAGIDAQTAQMKGDIDMKKAKMDMKKAIIDGVIQLIVADADVDAAMQKAELEIEALENKSAVETESLQNKTDATLTTINAQTESAKEVAKAQPKAKKD